MDEAKCVRLRRTVAVVRVVTGFGGVAGMERGNLVLTFFPWAPTR